MEIKWYTPDENGKVNIDGLVFKVRENVKYKNYMNALDNIDRVKLFVTFGAFSFILGFILLLGSVGRIELYSLTKEIDTWGVGKYLLLDAVGSVFLLAGVILARYGWTKEQVYQKWIDAYLGQYTTDEEAVEE